MRIQPGSPPQYPSQVRERRGIIYVRKREGQDLGVQWEREGQNLGVQWADARASLVDSAVRRGHDEP